MASKDVPPETPQEEEEEAEPVPEPEPELPTHANVEIPGVPGVHLSKVVASVWFPDKPNVLLGQPEPTEGEEEEAAPEEPAQPAGPTKELLFELIPRRVIESDACVAYNFLKKKVLKAEALYDEMPKDKLTEEEEDERARAQMKLNALKEELAAAEAKYAEIKPSFEPDPISTMPWVNNLMDVAYAGVQTFVVGGAFWPCTDMMKLFAAKTHYDDSEKLFTTFKTRYQTERTRPISLFHKLVPQIFQEHAAAPIDYVPLLNSLIRNTGQDPEAEGDEEGAGVAQLDLLLLYWWDTEESDYVAAAKAILATKKVKALGLVDFPLHSLKNMYRAGIDIAVLEVNWPLGSLEKKEYMDIVDYCQMRNIKVLYGDALVGGMMSCLEMGKLEYPGEGFRKKLDPAGPAAVSKRLVDGYGGWAAFQRLLEAVKVVADRKETSISTVMTGYYLAKGVHPIACVPWGPKCKERFPSIKAAEAEDFLDEKDMELLAAALCHDPSVRVLCETMKSADEKARAAAFAAAQAEMETWYKEVDAEVDPEKPIHRLEFAVDSWDVMAGVFADPPAKGKEPHPGGKNLEVLIGIADLLHKHSSDFTLHLTGKQPEPEKPEEPEVVEGEEPPPPPPPPEVPAELLEKFKMEFFGEPIPEDATLFMATARAVSVKRMLQKGFGPGEKGHLRAVSNPIVCNGIHDAEKTCVDMKLTC